MLIIIINDNKDLSEGEGRGGRWGEVCGIVMHWG
jgi:hypothetical protein